MSEIKAIVFDLGNVIIDLKDEATWWKEDIFPYFDEQSVKDLLDRKFFTDFESGKVDDDAFRRELHLIRKYDSEEKVVDNCWNSLLLEIPQVRVNLLEKLSQKFDLYLLSNTNNIHFSYIEQMVQRNFGFDIFNTFFRKCFFSHHMGMYKPNADIYEKVWQEIGVLPEHSIYLDDKPANLEVPKMMGIRTLLISPGEGFENILPECLSF